MSTLASSTAARTSHVGMLGTPFLLATGHAADVRPAAWVARALADERGAVPHVVRVHAIPAMDVAALGLTASPASPSIDARPDDAPDADDVAGVRAELAAAGVLSTSAWRIRVDVGTPSACIVREAVRVGAELIVLGMRHHGPADRAMEDNTALRVMRDASCQVLAVADRNGTRPALRGLPRRVLVGVDFGQTSRRAIDAALSLVADGGTLVLAYVALPSGRAPHEAAAEADEGEALVHALGVEAAFTRLVAELTAAMPRRRRAVFTCVIVPGVAGQGVARQLLAAAETHGADLIAVATQRSRPALVRFLVGSVTTELARAGQHALLVVPPAALDAVDV